jgi:Transposase DDE domain group 1
VTQCTSELTFSFYSKKPIRADFEGGQISSDAGLLVLRQFDQRHGWTADLDQALTDPRDPSRIHHPLLALLRQRLYAMCAGYEDANDAHHLRHDPILQILSHGKMGQALASQPTLSRLENNLSGRDIVRLTRLGLEWFIRGCGEQVRRRGEILLDIDSTHDRTHGQQQLSMFNSYYGEPVYHPLLMFEQHTGCLLDVRLRRGNCISYNRCLGRLRRLLRRLQQAFPKVRIWLRADAGFDWKPLYDLLEEEGVGYAIRIKSNKVLQRLSQPLVERAARAYQRQLCPQVRFTSFFYRAGNWKRRRRVLAKAESHAAGKEVYFILTNRPGSAQQGYEFYNGRGEGENRIGELKNGFDADRLSCHRFLANALRLALHAAAYNLVNLFRLRLPKLLQPLQIASLRQKIFKVGARVLQSTRCIWVHLASGWPHRSLLRTAAQACG